MSASLLLLGPLILFAVCELAHEPLSAQAIDSPAENRAVAFLSREVPRWKRENDCYSCHNNGDAARALLLAAARALGGSALDDRLDWLRQPARWDHNKTQRGVDDKPLARVQLRPPLQSAILHG